MPTVAVNDVELFYEDQGDGPALILGHGLAASHRSWEPLVAHLAHRYRCITFDARGTGDSSHPAEGYSFEQLADDVAGLANSLELSRFVYGGHGSGAMVGTLLGLGYPERLEGLVLIAPASANGIEGQTAEAAAQPYLELVEAARHGDTSAIAAYLQRVAARPLDERYLQHRAEAMAATAEEHLTSLTREGLGLRLRGELAEIRTPTLVVVGAGDSLLKLQLEDYLALPAANLHVLGGVGHEIPAEAPDALAALIDGFITLTAS